MARSLDVPEAQVAVDFFDDPTYHWHMRILIVNGGEGRWVWATPDLEVQFGDLSGHRVISVPRAAPYPARLDGNLYAFDPLTAEQLSQLRAEAAGLANVLGLKATTAAGVPAAPRWVVADPAHPRFGEELEPGVPFNEDRFVHRDAVGLARLGETHAQEERWAAVENVAADDHQGWLDEKHSGPGRDLRACPLQRVGRGGSRRQTIDQAIAAHRPADQKDWPFRGPRAVVELFEAVRASGLGFASYANHYVQVSGIATGGNVAHELRNLFNVLRHLSEYDQTDCSNLAAAELLARRIIQIQRAVKRNPKHPDFTGLEAMMASSLDESGGIVTMEFDAWVAQEQKTAAIIMKNHRMYAEEREEAAGRMGDPSEDAGAGRAKGKAKAKP